MKKLSLKKQLFNYLKFRKGEWIGGFALEDHGRTLGYKSSNAGRRMRELAENSYYIKRKEEKGLVYYRYEEPERGIILEKDGQVVYQPKQLTL